MPNFKQFSLLHDALLVRRTRGKGLLSQLIEILRAKRLNPTLGATDYFNYRLYDSSRGGASRPEDFLGWRVQEMLARTLNTRSAVMPAWDKFTFALFAHAFGLPVPRLRGLYKPGPTPKSGVADATFTSQDQLVAWLRTQGEWPLFAKPSYSQGGIGCYHLAGYSREDDSLVTSRGERLPVEHFASNVVCAPSGPYFQREMGYLFQEVLRSHERIGSLLGNSAISGVRVVVVHDDKCEPQLVTAFWKIVTGDNYIDNIHGFTTGNLTGEIDLMSGRLGEVLNGFGPRGATVSVSPGTGQAFDGFVLPYWQELVVMCKSAAPLFPLIRMQCWDIAITDRGPCIIELNEMPDIAVMQMWGRGVLTAPMVEVLRNRKAMPFRWISGPPRADEPPRAGSDFR